MAIIALPAFKDNYIWAIINESKHTFICIDPGEAKPILSYAKNNQLSLTHLLITHHHPDHIDGVAELLQVFPKTIVYGPNDARLPQINFMVRNEDIIPIDHYDFRILSTPGHTSSHICYQEPSKNWLFCGDTLFSAGCGRVFDGTMEDLYRSLLLLKKLPKDTQIYCAHEYTRQNLRFAAIIEPDNHTIESYRAHLMKHPNQCSLPSTLRLEKKINPFLRTDTQALQTFAQKEGINPFDQFAIFRHLRKKKDNFQ
ncbi:hydroxyacylglutathione hydrolase [Legionella nagasakiensis]|uniref:hydroxyacylglutathione hydrolase n=1 Tax=Legionella nagasakiensis TaxID=535290 RepID=UPI0010559A96|nr:hydroxyacylglutathione hydrolase [Legionella nagasakiensis]